jgi:mannosyltransferase OCH1-like enzyme
MLKEKHPDFKYNVYNDSKCRDFISKYYPKALSAYDTLIPHAYKSDLWRLCVLHKYGGIYLDIKFECVDGFTLHSVLDKEYYVYDYQPNPLPQTRVGNGFIVSFPDNPILLEYIERIVANVDTRFYGQSSLDITGPDLFGKIMVNRDIVLEIAMSYVDKRQTFFKDGVPIMREYRWYRVQTEARQNHYSILWRDRGVYIPNSKFMTTVNAPMIRPSKFVFGKK